MARFRVLEPDVGDLDPARVQTPGRDREADLLAVEGECRRRIDAAPGNLPCRRVHPR